MWNCLEENENEEISEKGKKIVRFFDQNPNGKLTFFKFLLQLLYKFQFFNFSGGNI